MSKQRTKRWVPPRWVLVILAILLVATAWIRIGDPMGDRGSVNFFTMLLAILAGLVLVVWFTFFSGHAWWVRLMPLTALAVFYLVFTSLFRIDQVSGEMIPSFVLKSQESSDRSLGRPDAAGVVDLTVTTADDFPEFLGPGRVTGVDRPALARDWETQPPELVWKREIGAGWSSFAIVNGVAVTMEQRGDEELVTAYDALTGEPRWVHASSGRFETLVAGVGPRATPTIVGGQVFAQGGTGRLVALDGATGELQWQKDLVAEAGMTAEQEKSTLPYGRSGSPLAVGGLVVVPLGGPPEGVKASLVAYDRVSGEEVWRGGDQQISCSSPTLAELGGVEQILIVNEDTVSGHAVDDGRVLWQHPWGEGRTNANANVSQAMAVPPNRVFLSKGYGIGAALLELTASSDGTFEVAEIWSSNRVMRTKMTNVAIFGDHVYGLSDGILEAIELATGERAWKGGRYKQGQILRVGDLLLVQAESGEMSLVEATPESRNSVLGSFRAIEGKSWNNPALYGRYLLVRNAEEAACFELPLAS